MKKIVRNTGIILSIVAAALMMWLVDVLDNAQQRKNRGRYE